MFAEDEFSTRDDLLLTAGLRNDDFDTFCLATTGRATAACLSANRALKLRAPGSKPALRKALVKLLSTKVAYSLYRSPRRPWFAV